MSGFTSATLSSELLEGARDIALEARLDGFLQGGIALAHDLVHRGGLHPRGLELGEGLAGVDGVELFGIPDENDPGDAHRAGDAQQVPCLHGGRQRALVDHQDGFREGGAHLLCALLREPSLGHAGVAGEEPLQGLGLDSRLRKPSVCTAEADGARPTMRQPFFSASALARLSMVVLPVPA